MKRVHAPGGMIKYVAIIVSCAWELTSVSMCYSQGNGFNTSLSRLLPDSVVVVVSVVSVDKCLTDGVFGVCGYVWWYGHVLPRTTLIKIMCVH